MKALKVLLMMIILPTIVFSCGDDDDDDSVSTGDDDVSDDDDDDDQVDDDDEISYPFCDVDYDRIELIMAKMSLRKKIGQMYVVGGQVVPWFEFGDTKRFIQEIGVGGVFIQPGTGVGLWPGWTVDNTNKLQSWALEGENPIPLIITCDQEGGIPQAVNNITGGTDTPGNLGLGATFDPAAARTSYDLMGRELHQLGVNNAYSPVAGLMITPDESSMYTRCFGESTQDVAAMVSNAVVGFQSNLIIAAAKHYPNHSTAAGDEHHGPVTNTESESAIRSKYFPAYQGAIDMGVDMIMSTHAKYTAWEETLPTTFSRTLITDILRDELGFGGLIVTDDINMGAITTVPWDIHPHVLAIKAGHDLVLDGGGDGETLYGMHPDNEKWAQDLEGQIDRIEDAVNGGSISLSQIDDSVRRILEVKMKYCLFENPYRDPETAAASVHTSDFISTSRELHKNALTLVKNEGEALPLSPSGGQKIHVVSIGPYQSKMYPDAFWGNISGTSLWMEVRKIYPSATGDLFDVEPSNRVINRIVQKAENADPDILIIGTYHAYYHQQQQSMVNQLLALDIPTILVAVALPYDFMVFPEAKVMLATYSNRDMALEAAAAAIFGEFDPAGRLPVTLPGAFDYGHNAFQD